MLWIKSLFKNPAQLRDVLLGLNEGDYVHLYFKKPNEIGIMDPTSLSCIRFNPDEMNREFVKGIVNRVWKEKSFSNSVFIEMTDVIQKGQATRKYLFLEQEIKKVKKMA